MFENLEYIKQLEDVYTLIKKSNDQMIQLWLQGTVFTWRWWIGIGLTIIPWVIWFFLVKKRSVDRLLYCAFFVILISSWLDVVGILLGAWSYYYSVVPLSPSFIPWDFTLMPVTIMLFLQIKPKGNKYFKAILFSIMGAYVAQPIFVWLNLYNPKGWQHYYSIPIFILIYLATHWFSRRTAFAELEES